MDANFLKEKIKEFCHKNANAFYADYLGKERFIYYLKQSDLFIGNSSSGIIEAPIARVPTLNIGYRQKGRVFAPSIFGCSNNKKAIVKKINFILKLKQKKKLYIEIYFIKKIQYKKLLT